jgi:hypothetical protein
MKDLRSGHKISESRLTRKAVVYWRQSSDKPVRYNQESQREGRAGAHQSRG